MKDNTQLLYVYGPIESWRMGTSLGIDPLSNRHKICNLDCVYCQLGKTHILTDKRKIYVPTRKILNEIIEYFKTGSKAGSKPIDYITFSGRGEPTLAANLGEIIKKVREIRSEEIAVITNSTLMDRSDVREDLYLSDLVIAKLDACDETSFSQVDKAMQGFSFEKTVEGLIEFKDNFKGRLALQIMFVRENQWMAHKMVHLARCINADEIQINTPLRPSAAKPISRIGIQKIKSEFAGLPAVTVYDRPRKETVPLNTRSTIKRHGNFRASSN